MNSQSYDLASESAFMDKLLSDTGKGEARWVGGISQGHKSSHTLKMMCLVFGKGFRLLTLSTPSLWQSHHSEEVGTGYAVNWLGGGRGGGNLYGACHIKQDSL